MVHSSWLKALLTINNQQSTTNNQQPTINNQQSTKNIYKLKTLYVCCTKLTGVDFYPKLKMPFRKSEIDFRQELGQTSTPRVLKSHSKVKSS
jgi:hypothetical protein